MNFLRTGRGPDEFWSLTLREVDLCIRAYNDDADSQMERLAWQTAHLMNASGNMKQRVTMKKLLGAGFRARKAAQKELTPAQKSAGWDSIREAVPRKSEKGSHQRRIAATKERARVAAKREQALQTRTDDGDPG